MARSHGFIDLADSDDDDDGALLISSSSTSTGIAPPSARAGPGPSTASSRRAFAISSQQAPAVRAPPKPAASRKRSAAAALSDGSSDDSSGDELLERIRKRQEEEKGGSGSGSGSRRQHSAPTGTTTATKDKGKGKQRASTSSGAADKEAERQAKQAEKARKQQEKAELAQQKKDWAEANKLRTSKTETSRELIVELDEGLFASSSSSSSGSNNSDTAAAPLAGAREALLDELKADGVTVVMKSRPHASLVSAVRAQQEELDELHAIRIKRRRKARLDPIRRSFVPLATPVIEEENTVLVCLTPQRLLRLIQDGRLLGTLRAFRENAGLLFHQVVLCVVGIEAYFRKARNKVNRQYTQAVRQQLHTAETGVQHGESGSGSSRRRGSQQPDEEPDVTREQFDREMMKAKIAERCFLVQVDKQPEMVRWIVSMVQDVGIRPYKLIRNSHLSFAVDAKKNTGATNEETFKMMLQQIPRMTDPQAASVVYTFGTWREMMEAAQKSEKDAIKEIAECAVATRADGAARARSTSVGNAMATRLVGFLRGRDPLTLMS